MARKLRPVQLRDMVYGGSGLRAPDHWQGGIIGYTYDVERNYNDEYRIFPYWAHPEVAGEEGESRWVASTCVRFLEDPTELEPKRPLRRILLTHEVVNSFGWRLPNEYRGGRYAYTYDEGPDEDGDYRISLNAYEWEWVSAECVQFPDEPEQEYSTPASLLEVAFTVAYPHVGRNVIQTIVDMLNVNNIDLEKVEQCRLALVNLRDQKGWSLK